MADRTKDFFGITTDIFEILSANWWAIAIRGLLGILAGVIAFLLPLPTLIALAWLFGAYAFLDGLFNLISAMRGNRARPLWLLLVEGIAGLVAGVLSFVWPGLTILALVFLVAAWALVTGALEIAAAIRLRRRVKGEWLMALAGIASVVLGVLLALSPSAGAVVLVWYLGAYCIVFGALQIALSFRLRSLGEKLKTGSARMAA